MEKIKILYYESSSGFGGSSIALVNLIKSLDKNKFCPIIAIKNFGPQIEEIRKYKIIKLRDYSIENNNSSKPNIKFFLVFLKNVLPEVLRLSYIIKINKISLVHINTNIFGGIPVIIAAKLTGIPSISHIRETREPIKRDKIFVRFVDKLIFVNNKAPDFYRGLIPGSKMSVIYDGIDLSEFNGSKQLGFKKELNLDSVPLVGLIGRIVKGKGQKEFILAAKLVLKIKPETKFVIVGAAKGENNDYYNETVQLIKKERLDRSIILAGWRNDINNVIADLDILVQATTTFPEGFGLTCIEGMALAKPVIATNIPGPSDIVIDGETGFLVTPGDIKAMAEKIIFLLDNPQSAKELGEKGKQRVESYFNIKKTVKKIEELYDEVLKTK